MIKINHSYTEDFLVRYEQYITDNAIPCFHNKVLNARGITLTERECIEGLFTDVFIRDLIFCDAGQLNTNIDLIYNHLPILAERYCFEYYLKDISLTSEEALMPISTNIAKSEIRQIYERVIIELQELSRINSSILLPTIINEIQVEENAKASEVKDKLKKINSMKLGNYKLTEENIALFPCWVNGFNDVFNYTEMSRMFGREITSSLNLDVCPYCNNEDIETIRESNGGTRPDLDHFYPKSKFPFFSVTLSNLIPSGKRCNQVYKGAVSMFGYMHPRIEGISQNRLFDFYKTPGEGINIDNVNIKIRKLNNRLDKNLDLFRVQTVHNKNNVKKWFLKLDERYQLIRNSSHDFIDDILDNDELIRSRLDVDVNESPTKEQFQKFKIDALNFMSGRNYQIAD
ncbi:hypothetical protein [Photobacterium leiognathi]|uniref:hypothetical protein n=1 Tax=Photobacterium leiognathi TaxID=553611 RepID=UPI002980C835|nr:hypothetical protein [Photobacterium leiognathi]